MCPELFYKLQQIIYMPDRRLTSHNIDNFKQILNVQFSVRLDAGLFIAIAIVQLTY